MRAYITTQELKDARDSIIDQFKENGDSPWLEGWICGFTDPIHQYDNESTVQEKLMDCLQSLRQQLIKNCDKCGEVAEEIYWDVLDEILLCPSCYIREMLNLTRGGDASEEQNSPS